MDRDAELDRVRTRRAPWIVLLVVLLGSGLVGEARAEAPPSTAHQRCADDDHVEPGLQGDVPKAQQEAGTASSFACGLTLVGHNDLGGRGGNWNMAWAGDCAYVTSSAGGVAVVDASNPSKPRLVKTLVGPGSTATKETIHAVETDDRAILVAGRYGNNPTVPGQNGEPTPMDVYDVSTCHNPKLLSTFWFPENIHNLTLSADAKTVFSTFPVQAVDLTDPRAPRFLGNIEKQVPYPSPVRYMSHEAWPSADGTRLYLGGQLPCCGFFTILDITDLRHTAADGTPDPVVRVVSQFKGRGHSIRDLVVDGKRYLLHSEESIVNQTAKGCLSEELNPVGGPAQPYLTDITAEETPATVSQFELEINEPQNCPQQLDSGVNASVHYHDVDDPEDTSFAMLSMWNAGMRVVDVRQPTEPREIAYFNPGVVDGRLDQAWGHVRFVRERGQIWFSTATGGFWIVQLQPQVLEALGMGPVPAAEPLLPPGVGPHVTNLPAVPTDAAYCTVDGATSSLEAYVPGIRDLPLPPVNLF